MILIVGIIVIGLTINVLFRIYPQQTKPIPQTTPDASATQPKNGNIKVQGTLVLIEQSTNQSAGNIVIYKLMVDSTALLAGIEGNFNFNNQQLEIISLEPGNLFQNPEILTENINSSGTINYTIGTLNPIKAQGELMRIKAKILKDYTVPALRINQTTTKIAFLDINTKQPFTESETAINFQ